MVGIIKSNFNAPIIADTKLDYPYDEDCIFKIL